MFRLRTLTVAAVSVLLCCSRSSAEESEDPKTTSESSKEPLALVDGIEISTEDYQRFLYHLVGKQRLAEFIDKILVEEEATRLGIRIDYQRIEKETEKQLQEALGVFNGNRELYQNYLQSLGLTYQEQVAKLRLQVVQELALNRCILASREVDDDDVKAYFEEVHGKDGRSEKVRHILVWASDDTETPPPAEKVDKAKEILTELEKTSDFAALAEKYSVDRSTQEKGGLLDYQPGIFGQRFDRALAQLKEPGETSGILYTENGIEIIQLVERKIVRFEDVKDELKKELQEKPPTPQERQEFLQRLRERAKVTFAE